MPGPTRTDVNQDVDRDRSQPQGVDTMRTPPGRRAASDRAPAAPRASGGRDDAAPPRDDAAAPEDLDGARMVLVVHRLDPDTGRCAACAADCPCGPALEAGRALVKAGAWNTVSFTGRRGLRADRERPAPGAGRSARLTQLIRPVRLIRLARLSRYLPWTVR